MIREKVFIKEAEEEIIIVPVIYQSVSKRMLVKKGN
jgi:hypothetical protein